MIRKKPFFLQEESLRYYGRESDLHPNEMNYDSEYIEDETEW